MDPHELSNPTLSPSNSNQSANSTQSAESSLSGTSVGRPTELALENTPVAWNENSSAKYGSVAQDYESRYIRYAQEAESYALGPMPPDVFVNTFLPSVPLVGMPSPKDAFNKVPLSATEGPTFAPLAEAINTHVRCPGYKFCDTSQRSVDGTNLGAAKPDGIFYPEDVKPSFETIADLGYARLPVELKGTDPFIDVKADSKDVSFFPNFATDKKRLRHLGQNVHYAAEMLARQHRTFCFSLFIFHGVLRFARWDRAGVVITAPYDYVKDPYLLCDFLWRFSHASLQDNGYDMTVSPASDAEENLFKDVIAAHIRNQLGLSEPDTQVERDELKRHYIPHRVTVVVVHDNEDAKERQVLVCRPVTSPLSVASRATRGYWAVDLQDRRIAFLKDIWRTHVAGIEQEGTILKRLRGQGVPNIPIVAYHGDVMSSESEVQHTLTDTIDIERESWVHVGAKFHVNAHTHYRLVLWTVGFPLKTIHGSAELLGATHDVYEAMLEAFNRARVLHRDISAGNILLVRDVDASPTDSRRGVLIDWEFACGVDPIGPRTYRRTGTWPFLSERLAVGADKSAHKLKDDMESILYVVLFAALSYLAHNVDDIILSQTLELFFHAVRFNRAGCPTGGDGKSLNKSNRRYTQDVKFKNPVFNKFIHRALDYMAPLPEKPQYQGKWDDPRELDQLWLGAIKSNTLLLDKTLLDDRDVHWIQNPAPTDYFRATTMHSSLFALETVDPDERKRMRLHTDEGSGGTAKKMPRH